MIKTISPIDGSLYYTADEHNLNDVSNALSSSQKALPIWSHLSVQQRAEFVRAFVAAIVADTSAIAEEITWQMGRPISQSPWEVGGFSDRANYMIDIAEGALKNQPISDDTKYKRCESNRQVYMSKKK